MTTFINLIGTFCELFLEFSIFFFLGKAEGRIVAENIITEMIPFAHMTSIWSILIHLKDLWQKNLVSKV